MPDGITFHCLNYRISKFFTPEIIQSMINEHTTEALTTRITGYRQIGYATLARLPVNGGRYITHNRSITILSHKQTIRMRL